METSDAESGGGNSANEASVPMIDRATALAPGGVTGLSPLGVNLPLAPSGDPGWLLVEEGFTLVREHEIEIDLCRRQRIHRHEGVARGGKPALTTGYLRRRDLRR